MQEWNESPGSVLVLMGEGASNTCLDFILVGIVHHSHYYDLSYFLLKLNTVYSLIF